MAVPGGRRTDDGRFVISPKTSQKLALTVPTRYIRSREPYSKTLEVETNDPDKPLVRLTMSFTVKDVLLVRPDPVDFGSVKPLSVYKRERTVVNKCDEPVTLTKVTAFPDTVLDVALKGKPRIEPSSKAVLELTYKPSMPGERFLGIVQLETSLEKIPVKNIQVRAQVSGD